MYRIRCVGRSLACYFDRGEFWHLQQGVCVQWSFDCGLPFGPRKSKGNLKDNQTDGRLQFLGLVSAELVSFPLKRKHGQFTVNVWACARQEWNVAEFPCARQRWGNETRAPHFVVCFQRNPKSIFQSKNCRSETFMFHMLVPAWTSARASWSVQGTTVHSAKILYWTCSPDYRQATFEPRVGRQQHNNSEEEEKFHFRCSNRKSRQRDP